MNLIKKNIIEIFLKIMRHEKVQYELNNSHRLRNARIGDIQNEQTPYHDICHSSGTKLSSSNDAIFITSRFRSGSTFLWNIFRHLDGCTAYYEPFNERQWFNSTMRGNRVDATHLGVENYWTEYEGMDDLSQYYNEDWIRQELLMDKKSWNPSMNHYIDQLISRANGRAVLQFNRVDFRLPWLRHHYPANKIIHLYRHPRDQWLSFLTDKELMNRDDVVTSYIDGFYLDTWCQDLSKFFPFLSLDLSPHPYQRFYYLWKLSYLYGQKYSDVSICFEELVESPGDILTNMFNNIEWTDEIPWKQIIALVKKPEIGKWKSYAGNNWFATIEDDCEVNLTRFLEANRQPL